MISNELRLSLRSRYLQHNNAVFEPWMLANITQYTEWLEERLYLAEMQNFDHETAISTLEQENKALRGMVDKKDCA